MTDAVLKPKLIIRQFNQLTPYLDRFQDMKNLTENRDENTPDELWILQHHDVLTQGQAGKPEHILMSSNIPVVQTDRGGQVTWHGPGQLVAYFMFDLNRLGWNVRTLVSYAENLMIALLKKYGIAAYAKPDAPGVYVNERKIGSLGFKIRKGRSYHGLALNIDCDLSGFHTINPCGYAGLEMVRIQDLVPDYPKFENLCIDIIETLNSSGYFSEVQIMQQ
ncbi:lipoyl(octanoyl) transferase LipB [Acinetobacter sp. ANC 4216]|uniref:lipoyl(octanoyl) transferase LipB n=1 Tax=unclassified Acinetobacter TaxID=196816 RepID=UPI001040C9CA|nr:MULTISPECIES: lipoyl(octanoyl) transferase LipB [unclassified Acinetobacter]MCT8089027.1 lipoyl(octanoyl) transferase LipB [Acinetobacter sp. F_3_1]MCT8097182.1 lipoyl(octanoyl) transferase LipB [Acinetobacter sp. C_3_1]MCT8099825.1 lipoyl(octanoyl) transferase LipB [Acinetobacter sp. C_4_1]MCT8134225.1 lipoyl(octanoyl) transferase LipB [Acinetobacter sp. T_3_1]TCB69903.1 lipoyl(octanoyl) transferase LipB [Acinetobacter sp. ANC 4216]